MNSSEIDLKVYLLQEMNDFTRTHASKNVNIERNGLLLLG